MTENARVEPATPATLYPARGAGKLRGILTGAFKPVLGSVFATTLLAAIPAFAWEYWGGDPAGCGFRR
jgi:hypothetical protein